MKKSRKKITKKISERNMHKIIISLFTIAIVATITVGATRAYFSDTETSTNNIIQTGTVDIDIDGNNPWIGKIEMENMSPGESKDVNFVIHNTGTYPVNVWKKLANLTTETGVQSEPECRAESGTWNDVSKNCTGMTAEDNEIDKVIDYSLKVELYRGSTNAKIWDQVIYNGNYTVNRIKDLDMILGMIPVGDYMKVFQTYKFESSADNRYQGDKMTFNIKVIAQQLTGTVVLENKGGNWLIQHDNTQAILNYTTKAPQFGYNLKATGLLANTSYSLIYYSDPWNVPNSRLIGQATSQADGSLAMSGATELSSSLPASWGDPLYPDGAKVWLVPSIYFSGNKINNWNQGGVAYETGLIQYEDTGTGDAIIPADPTMPEAPDDNNPPAVTSQTISINDLGGDINNQYGYQFAGYSTANVAFTYNTPASGKLSGTITASGLKPYATYQVKFTGKSTDAVTNEYIGYRGRWSCVSGTTCTGDAVHRNRTDAQYEANKVLADSNPNKEVIVGYLVWDFFTADASGNATKAIETDNSYHVLFANGGLCNSTDNSHLAFLDSSHSTVEFVLPENVGGQTEPGRLSCGAMSLATGTYNLKMALTEESFHQGNWATVLTKDISFVIN
jgi:predicted ribosomally synthesized peptide with SipW-like signal peptide